MMKIKHVKCGQFAGLIEQEVTFEDGLNLMIGKNESGKSTMVDLIYHLLFQDVKLDGRTDSDFIDKYFPKRIYGEGGNFIAGTLVFETENGTYKLNKEWEKGVGSGRLTLPDGTSIKNDSDIREVLAGELEHRAGVYSEIVFASQKRTQMAVESVMRALSEKKTAHLSATREDLASVLTQASSELGGVSLEKMEKALQEKIEALLGRWDQNADAPEGGPKRASYKNAWVKGAGRIVNAYYEMDQVREIQAATENAERIVESEKADIQILQQAKAQIEEERKTFQKYRGLLGQISLLSKDIKRQEESIAEQEKIIQKWPELNKNFRKAKELQEKQKQAAVHELYLKAWKAKQEYDNKKSEFEALREVKQEDVRTLDQLLSRKQTEEGKLAGMNLVAEIKPLGETPVEVKLASSETVLNPVDGEIEITEAVDIAVPGVLEMRLKPKGVDVQSVNACIQQIESEIKRIYKKYEIDNRDELQSLAVTYSDTEKEVSKLKMNLEQILGDNTWEDIKNANDAVPIEIETETEIKYQILDLCGGKSIDAFIGSVDTTIGGYREKYESIEKLRNMIERNKKEKDTNQAKLNAMDQIPEEFQGIDDPDQYDADFQERMDDYGRQIKDHDARLRDVERKLGEKSAEEYFDELQEKERIFEAAKAECEHWLHINEVFHSLKEQISANPVEDIAEKFGEYLAVVTENGLKLNEMDEQMTVQIASGRHTLLTYDILSAGTRDTISLAFRLAMLEHLYPEGDGLAVFDDPFTDMDPMRVNQACRLIQKFAENNQVIFITCDDKYQNLMDGNVVTICNTKLYEELTQKAIREYKHKIKTGLFKPLEITYTESEEQT